MEIADCFVSSTVDSSGIVNGKRMCSILIILELLNKLGHKDNNDINLLFSMLCFKPPDSSQTWEDLSFLLSFIPNECHMNLAKVLVNFVNAILPVCSDLNRIEWLYVIPLVHIFQKKTVPFKPPALTSKEIRWFENCGIELTHIENNPRRSASR